MTGLLIQNSALIQISKSDDPLYVTLVRIVHQPIKTWRESNGGKHSFASKKEFSTQ